MVEEEKGEGEMMEIIPSRFSGQIYIKRNAMEITVREGSSYPNALYIEFDKKYHLVVYYNKVSEQYMIGILDKKHKPNRPFDISEKEWRKTLKRIGENTKVLYEKPTKKKR